MGKVIKILIKTVASIILASIIIPVILALSLHIPTIQNFVVDQVMTVLSKKLDTHVSVDHVSIKLINSVVLDGLYVEDSAQDTLLYCKQLSVGITNLGIIRGNLSLGAVKLDNTHFYLRQMQKSGVSNLKEILLKFKSDKPKSGKDFSMNAASLDINNMVFTFRKIAPMEREYGVNFDDIEVSRFNLSATKISVVNDSIALSINNLNLTDKSGFSVNSLTANEFAISGTGLLFDKLTVDTPHSYLNADFLHMRYDSWDSYSDFIRKVTIESKIVNSTISYSTIAYFAPTLRSWKTTYTNVSANVRGTVDNMSGVIENLQMNETQLATRFALTGIPDINNTRFDINIESLKTNIKDIDTILSEITGKHLSTDGILGKFGEVSLKGGFTGLLNKFSADAVVRTNEANAELKLTFSPDREKLSAFSGEVAIEARNIGKLFNNKTLGEGKLSAQINGLIGAETLKSNIIAELKKLNFNKYNYTNIKLDGVINDRTYQGSIISADPNIDFDFYGLLDFTDSIPSYNLDLKLANADLHKLNLNKRDTISQLSCRFKATSHGRSLDDFNGVAIIDDLVYINPIDSVKTGEIRFIGDNDQNNKSLSMYSAFADIQFKSRIPYSSMYQYIRSLLGEYLPVITAPDKSQRIDYASTSGTADISGYSLFKVDVKEANNVAGIFVPGLQFAKGTTLSFMFNPDARKFSLSASSDYIESEKFFVSKLNINSRNQADSLSLFVRSEDLFVGGMYMPNFSIIGGARDNRFNLSTRFNDPKKGVSALIGVIASLKKDKQSGIPQVQIALSPSTFISNNRTWRISARDILYDTTKVSINNFRISSAGQLLTINGTASKSKTDTLSLDLSNFDIAPFSQLTSRAGYDLVGRTNGYAKVSSVLSEPSIYSRINFDSVRVNGITMPSAVFVSSWDFMRDRAKFSLTKKDADKEAILGYYSPTDGRYLVDINLEGIDLSLINPVLSGVLKDSEGTADAALRLVGTKAQPLVSGTIKVNKLNTTVDYTNVPYQVNNATIDVKDNIFTLQTTNVYDPKNNSASLDMTLGSHYFSNIYYDIRIRPRNLMVINTTLANNGLFYGTIFASGAAQIKGNKRGVDMTIIASTDDHSAFYMPLSNKATISEADFITFETKNNSGADTTNYLVRKRMMFERKNRLVTTSGGNMNISMAITVKPNTDFQLVIDPTVGDILKGRGNGLLNITINPNNNIFSMYGDYQITEGSYLFTLQNIINKKFIIEPGSMIKWTGEPLDAMLDITAIYKLKASLAPLLSSNDENMRRSVPVDCQIKFTDRLSQPTINFDVSVQNVDPETQSLVANALNTQEMMATQFFWLLAVNSFYADTGSSQNMNIGAMGGSVTGFEFLSNQLSNWVSSDKYNIGIRYRPRSDMTSDELDIGLSTAIIDNRLLLEVEGNYDFGNNAASLASSNPNSLTGDFYLTWLIDRAGNLRAKAFSRTIDRFDENQGLQENGIGIYYKEDFNSFRDIITNIRERFKKKAKQETDTKIESQTGGTQTDTRTGTRTGTRNKSDKN